MSLKFLYSVMYLSLMMLHIFSFHDFFLFLILKAPWTKKITYTNNKRTIKLSFHRQVGFVTCTFRWSTSQRLNFRTQWSSPRWPGTAPNGQWQRNWAGGFVWATWTEWWANLSFTLAWTSIYPILILTWISSDCNLTPISIITVLWTLFEC